MSYFSDKLNEKIKEKGYTKREFAKLVGLSEQCISRYTSGNRVPKATSIVKIAEVLNTSVDELCGESKNGRGLTARDILRILSIKSNDTSLGVNECLEYHRASLIVRRVVSEYEKIDIME